MKPISLKEASADDGTHGSPVILGEKCNNCLTVELDELAIHYHTLLKIGKELLGESDVDRLLSMAMDRAMAIAGAERGFIVLFDSGGEMILEVLRNLRQEELGQGEFAISRAIIDRVKTEKRLVCWRQTLEEPERLSKNGTLPKKVFAIICFPLRQQGQTFGVIYLDNHFAPKAFHPAACVLVTILADFITLAAYHALERKQLRSRVESFEMELRGKYRLEAIVGHHPKMLEVLQLVTQIAATTATVLIQGESGTGKELIARALHYNSPRHDKPFVPVNCAAVPENLLESELFGHIRGAFTGAIRDSVGWFERANGGTIFLDEISEMPPALQMKLLRILQTGEYARLGSSALRFCDVRVIAAASRDLRELMQEKKFRDELYYRLSVIDIWLPPLRERQLDIPVLVQHFLKMYGNKYGKENVRLSAEVETLLMNYDFPGNVRELENVMQRAVVLADHGMIEAHHLPMRLHHKGAVQFSPDKLLRFKTAKQQAVAAFEREYIMACLKASQGNIKQAAQIAEIDIKNFYTKMKQHGINPQAFKTGSN